MSTGKWVQTWGMSHSALSYFYYPSTPKTFRLIFSTNISGEKIRIRLSNTYGKKDVKIGAMSVAPCDRFGKIDESVSPMTLKINGNEAFILKKGKQAVTDAVDFDLGVGEYACASVYVEHGDLTSGNLLDNVELITVKDNHVYDRFLRNEVRVRDSVIAVASNLVGMYFPKPIPLFDSIELYNKEGASSIVVFGDSVSQQGRWTNPFEARIREEFPGKYSFVNRSVMGCRLLRDTSKIFPARNLFGDAAPKRFKVDILPYDDISHVILFMGVNDIIQYASINAFPWELPNIKKMGKIITDMTKQMQAKGIKVMGINVPAFGWGPDATPEKDEYRKQLNKWYEENKDIFDDFYDISSDSETPGDPYHTIIDFVGLDNLHPNPFGGNFFAQRIKMEMFK